MSLCSVYTYTWFCTKLVHNSSFALCRTRPALDLLQFSCAVDINRHSLRIPALFTLVPSHICPDDPLFPPSYRTRPPRFWISSLSQVALQSPRSRTFH
jgi:hypothetical protein